MEPLFLAAICGCNAGLFRDTLHEIYIARIQRGNAFFASNILGARGALLSVLVHFFERGRWGSPVEKGVEGQSLTAEDQLFILMQAGLYLTATRGAAPEAQICYERAESLCHSLNRPLLLYSALMGQWRYSHITDKLTATMLIAQRVYSLAQEQHDSALMIGACNALAGTLYFMGDFEAALRYAIRGVQIWRSESVQSQVQEVGASAVSVLCYEGQARWHLGEIASSQTTLAEAISLAKEMNNMHGLAVALWHAAVFAYYDGNPAEVERLASNLTSSPLF
jgi:tetratricopeptide (TPR) repeat protein